MTCNHEWALVATTIPEGEPILDLSESRCVKCGAINEYLRAELLEDIRQREPYTRGLRITKKRRADEA